MARLMHDDRLAHRIGDWITSMKDGRLDEAYLATKLPAERSQLQQEFASRRLLCENGVAWRHDIPYGRPINEEARIQ